MINNVLHKSFKVLPHMCKQQADEIQQLISAADEIGAAATCVAALGGQGYERLLEARDQFRSILLDASKRYRIFIEEE